MLVNILVYITDQLAGQFKGFPVKHNEDDFHIMRKKELANRAECDTQGFILRETIHTCGDKRERYALC